MTLATLIRVGGLLHFGILIASALVPQVLDWRAELRKLQPLSRQLVWVHGVFIVLTIIALGAIATINAPITVPGRFPTLVQSTPSRSTAWCSRANTPTDNGNATRISVAGSAAGSTSATAGTATRFIPNPIDP